ncbi:MAG: LacI family transcriptional regulator [Chloroflexi bacterium]|nr:MAG: LacI family transcriptional regulator [Chloroflexota bacterium]MBL1193777.1 LacI family transcriptional regulator [Chloroflexota bacterium]NOH11070.1 LacI family DNA-binding transcriptional regulator [Chloroflexota bacterium]
MTFTPTIRDVARKAEVGIGTVSRVLNNSPSVSEVTRQRVLDVIEELNFTPNPIARRLSSGTTHTVAIILPNLTSPSLVERLRGVQSALADSDYALVLYSAETTERLEELFNTIPNKANADGILIVSIPPTDEHLEHFSKSGVPIVLIDVKEPQLDHVFVDDTIGGEIATQHLIDLGHTNIAFISDPIDTLFSFGAMKNRLQGYKKALRKAGIKFNKGFHVEGLPQAEIVKNLTKDLLRTPNAPTAIFAASDAHAIGVIYAARELGIHIPKELSVIGFDDIRDAEYLNLTTVRQPLFESGHDGIDLLFSTMKQQNGNKPRSIKQDLEIIRRGTTATLQ